MTENKRFTYDNKQVAILKNNKFWLEGAIATACNHSEICNELNALVNENEELKDRIDFYNISLKKLQDLTERKINENEQLKSKNRGLQSELQIFKEDVNHSNLQINKLVDENKQLKKQCKDFIEMLDDMSVAYLINDGLEEILND